MVERGRSRSPKNGKHLAGDSALERDVEGVGPVRGRDLFISVRPSVDGAAVTFHTHSVVLLKYLQEGAFRDHLAFAEEYDGDSADTVELVGDPPHVWRTLLELIYKHFDLLYHEDNQSYTSFDDLADSLLGTKIVATDTFDLAFLTHKHGCKIFRTILEKRLSRSFYSEKIDSSSWLKFWTPANAGVLLRCGMKKAAESWFMPENFMEQPSDIPCARVNNFLRDCTEDELRCIALYGASNILRNMKDEEAHKAEGDGLRHCQLYGFRHYQLYGFRHYWDNHFCREGYSDNTVAKIDQMLEVIMETCKDCPGCADAIRELCKVTPECLETSRWEAFVSEQGLGRSD